MVMRGRIIWSIKELVEVLRSRQLNKFDVNVGVSGARGDGKSTLINKVLLRMPGFKQFTHQVYTREDVINLLKEQKFSYCWDDEAINSGYKREFQNKEQHNLIKIITTHRSNYNVYFSAIPNFYSLDRDLRDLIFLHIHILERGLAVLFMPLDGAIFQNDKWDASNNQKIEKRYFENLKKGRKSKPPYHKFSTFVGYLYFGDLTEKQRKKYEEIKEKKRALAFKKEEKEKGQEEQDYYEHLLNMIMKGDINSNGFAQILASNRVNPASIRARLNNMLKARGEMKTLSYFLNENNSQEIEHKKEQARQEIDSLVPDI